MILIKDNDVYKVERKVEFTNEETITFKHPKPYVYQKASYDWYMTAALEKSDKVKEDRHLLTSDIGGQFVRAITMSLILHFKGIMIIQETEIR